MDKTLLKKELSGLLSMTDNLPGLIEEMEKIVQDLKSKETMTDDSNFILKEFEEWHTKISLKNWWHFPKNLWKHAKIEKWYWYWKWHNISILHLKKKSLWN